MKKFNRIGLLTSGGDAPGMNAAVRAVVRAALDKGVEVLGIYRGYSGLIEGDIHKLEVRDVSNIISRGGTMLLSDRCLEFKTPEGMAKAVENCKKFGIEGVIAIGGDGTFRGATDLTAHGVPCIGIPATIDNDISSTDNSIGFDTAMNTVIDLVDKLRDTCESHARCNVVEVMGRGAGDIALSAGIASGATAIIIPEIQDDMEYVVSKVAEGKSLGKRNFLVLVSEGVGSEFGPEVAKLIQERTGVETKFCRPAHIVRGGSPTLRDRVLASRYGVAAVEQLLKGESNIVMCDRMGEIIPRDINFALMVDRMYKGKLKDGDLDKFSAEDVAHMERIVARRRENIEKLYTIAKALNL